MDFQERMSNTVWQRGVTDMRAVGANLRVAYKQGGVSSPIGASATMQNPNYAYENTANSSSNIFLQATQNEKTKAETVKTSEELNKVRVDIDNIEAGTALTLEKKYEVAENILRIREDAYLKIKQSEQVDSSISKMSEEERALTYKNNIAEIKDNFLKSAELKNVAKELGVSISVLTEIFNSLLTGSRQHLKEMRNYEDN